MSDLRGRFDGALDDEMLSFSSSLELDLELADDDIQGSLAHVRMLGETGVIPADEATEIAVGLETIRGELASGGWTPDPRFEDIHMAVEARLVELVGPIGGKLHTARSRNDQVATAVRLWLRRRLGGVDHALRGLIGVLLERIETDGRTLMPGYTHLQRGQPIWLGHHLLAHAWALTRDRERLAGALERVDRCPLGACAMAGTGHPIDRDLTAGALGFSAIAVNAMDAVSARDHLQEVAAVCAITMSGLSRLAAELVLWSSSEFGLIRLGEDHATGSSIMPQKRNPDGAELIRGKTGRVYGDLHSLLVLTKGLPLAYNRDLQEDRSAVTDALDQCQASLRIMAAMWRRLKVLGDRFSDELAGDFSLATELADLLVARGVPFRTAHEAVGSAVRWCDEQGGDLRLLDGGTAARFHHEFPDDLSPWLDPEAAVERRTSLGGTAWSQVERQLGRLRSML
jgi:argininosuccinate lyase